MSDAHVPGLLRPVSCSRTFTPLEVAWTVSFSLLYPGPKFSEHSPSGAEYEMNFVSLGGPSGLCYCGLNCQQDGVNFLILLQLFEGR